MNSHIVRIFRTRCRWDFGNAIKVALKELQYPNRLMSNGIFRPFT